VRLFDAAFALLEKTAVEHRLAVFGSRWMMHGRKNKKPEALGGDLGASKRWHKMVTHRVMLGIAQVCVIVTFSCSLPCGAFVLWWPDRQTESFVTDTTESLSSLGTNVGPLW
jgi:hypothetical protein